MTSSGSSPPSVSAMPAPSSITGDSQSNSPIITTPVLSVGTGTMQLSVCDAVGHVTSVRAFPWTSIRDLKDSLQHPTGVMALQQRLFHAGHELRNTRTLHDVGVQDGASLFITAARADPQSVRGKAAIDLNVHVYGDCPCPPALHEIIRQVRLGLASGLAPRLAMEGTAGTYFLRNAQRQNVAVFKPGDEEPYAPNNPRGHVGMLGQYGFRAGVLSGEGHLREVAASLLDRDGFASVPLTTLVEMSHPAFHNSDKLFRTSQSPVFKVGSFQQFVDQAEMAADLATQTFPVDQVHKIGILDLRLVNTDRNDANILVKRYREHGTDRVELIPIDHSYCLPDTLEIAWTDWAWLEWPQAKQPFSARTLAYIEAIDVEADIQLLADRLSIREPCLHLMRLVNTVLKRGAAAGLTLHQIATLVVRDDVDRPSDLEMLCQQATALARSVTDNPRLKSLMAPLSSHSSYSAYSHQQQQQQLATPSANAQLHVASASALLTSMKPALPSTKALLISTDVPLSSPPSLSTASSQRVPLSSPDALTGSELRSTRQLHSNARTDDGSSSPTASTSVPDSLCSCSPPLSSATLADTSMLISPAFDHRRLVAPLSRPDSSRCTSCGIHRDAGLSSTATSAVLPHARQASHGQSTFTFDGAHRALLPPPPIGDLAVSTLDQTPPVRSVPRAQSQPDPAIPMLAASALATAAAPTTAFSDSDKMSVRSPVSQSRPPLSAVPSLSSDDSIESLGVVSEPAYQPSRGAGVIAGGLDRSSQSLLSHTHTTAGSPQTAPVRNVALSRCMSHSHFRKLDSIAGSAEGFRMAQLSDPYSASATSWTMGQALARKGASFLSNSGGMGSFVSATQSPRASPSIYPAQAPPLLLSFSEGPIMPSTSLHSGAQLQVPTTTAGASSVSTQPRLRPLTPSSSSTVSSMHAYSKASLQADDTHSSVMIPGAAPVHHASSVYRDDKTDTGITSTISNGTLPVAPLPSPAPSVIIGSEKHTHQLFASYAEQLLDQAIARFVSRNGIRKAPRALFNEPSSASVSRDSQVDAESGSEVSFVFTAGVRNVPAALKLQHAGPEGGADGERAALSVDIADEAGTPTYSFNTTPVARTAAVAAASTMSPLPSKTSASAAPAAMVRGAVSPSAPRLKALAVPPAAAIETLAGTQPPPLHTATEDGPHDLSADSMELRRDESRSSELSDGIRSNASAGTSTGSEYADGRAVTFSPVATNLGFDFQFGNSIASPVHISMLTPSAASALLLPASSHSLPPLGPSARSLVSSSSMLRERSVGSSAAAPAALSATGGVFGGSSTAVSAASIEAPVLASGSAPAASSLVSAGAVSAISISSGTGAALKMSGVPKRVYALPPPNLAATAPSATVISVVEVKGPVVQQQPGAGQSAASTSSSAGSSAVDPPVRAVGPVIPMMAAAASSLPSPTNSSSADSRGAAASSTESMASLPAPAGRRASILEYMQQLSSAAPPSLVLGSPTASGGGVMQASPACSPPGSPIASADINSFISPVKPVPASSPSVTTGSARSATIAVSPAAAHIAVSGARRPVNAASSFTPTTSAFAGDRTPPRVRAVLNDQGVVPNPAFSTPRRTELQGAMPTFPSDASLSGSYSIVGGAGGTIGVKGPSSSSSSSSPSVHPPPVRSKLRASAPEFVPKALMAPAAVAATGLDHRSGHS